MSNDINSTAPTAPIATIPLFKLRIAIGVLSIVAVIFPLVSMKIGVSQGFTLVDGLGAIAYLIPLAFVGAFIAAYHPPLREHSGLADKISAGVLGFFLIWGIWELAQGVSQALEISRQLRGMPGMPAMSASGIGQIFKIFSPGFGLVGLVGTFTLGFVPVIKGRKKT